MNGPNRALEDDNVLAFPEPTRLRPFGESEVARKVERRSRRVAATSSTVLLLGESGVGKGFVARRIHDLGPRAKAPLRSINCASIPESLFESELFGHERGAFSGAVNAREGAFEAVGEGTLFLDEIGELPLTSQAKLLRVLEDKRFERVGSNRSLTLRARIIVATNRDLAGMVRTRAFREDLYHRLSVVPVHIPALREREDDIPALAHDALDELAPIVGRRAHGFSPAALDVLRRYPWPGNVRELRNAIEHALVMGDGDVVEPEDFPPPLCASAPPPAAGRDGVTLRLPAPLAEVEQQAIDAALAACDGNRMHAATLLGINRQTLYNKLARRGM